MRTLRWRRPLGLALLACATQAVRREIEERVAACKAWPWQDSGDGAWDEGGLFGKSGRMAVRPRARHTRLEIFGSHPEIAPLPQEQMAVPGARSPKLQRKILDEAATKHVPAHAWAKVARLAHRRRAKLVVLGCSTTSGCGAAEPWQLVKLHDNERAQGMSYNKSLDVRLCNPALGWARRLDDALAQLQEWHGLAFDVSVVYKNAVRADFFAHCTSNYVPPDADIVLLEVSSNLWGIPADGVLRAVRTAAPRAIIIFVNWAGTSVITGGRVSDYERISAAAAAGGADIIHVDEVTAFLSKKLRIYRREVFAQSGLDHAHPSPFGHALLGAVVARFIARRLLSALCDDVPTDRVVTKPIASDSSAAVPTNSTLEAERCFPVADKLPVVPTSGTNWTLVDDGVRKGVQKLGLLSKQLGDYLELEPWPTAGCFVMSVQLGYLVSATRPNMGGFRITCPNCACVGKKSPFPQLHPFPEVQTNAQYNEEESYYSSNMTVTALTEFLIFPERTQQGPCRVGITHIRASSFNVRRLYHRDVPRRNVPQDSQIRIDSLTTMLWTNSTSLGRDNINYLKLRGGHSMRQHVRELFTHESCPKVASVV